MFVTSPGWKQSCRRPSNTETFHRRRVERSSRHSTAWLRVPADEVGKTSDQTEPWKQRPGVAGNEVATPRRPAGGAAGSPPRVCFLLCCRVMGVPTSEHAATCRFHGLCFRGSVVSHKAKAFKQQSTFSRPRELAGSGVVRGVVGLILTCAQVALTCTGPTGE